jgi:hypothetical protein
MPKPFKGVIKLDIRDSTPDWDAFLPDKAPGYSLCGEGLCIGYDGGDAVSSESTPKFEFTGGTVVKVVFDVADDAYVDVEKHLAAAMARD